MKIIKFSAENVKRLKAVEISPAGELVVIGGKNDAGKSSVLDAIEMAMGGETRTPAEPVRRGEKDAKVVLDLGDIIVTRTFKAAGGRKLVVENKDGARFTSPQAMLDKLWNALTFDPLAFERMDAKPQAETLRSLVGLDLSDLDGKRIRLYEERTEQNRSLKALEVQVDALEDVAGLPEAEVSIAALAAELEAAEKQQQAANRTDAGIREAKSSLAAADQRRQGIVNEITTIEKRLTDLGVALQEADADLKTRAAGIKKAEKVAAEFVATLPDTAAIRGRLAAAEGVNRQVRLRAQRLSALSLLKDAKAVAGGLTARIEALDVERVTRLASVTFPVPGLGIDEDGVTLNGLPFAQASTSDRIRTSVAIGLAQNPGLRVLLVRDGSLLGSEKLDLLATMAKEADVQLWLELLQEKPDGRTSVFIADGEVAK